MFFKHIMLHEYDQNVLFRIGCRLTISLQSAYAINEILQREKYERKDTVFYLMSNHEKEMVERIMSAEVGTNQSYRWGFSITVTSYDVRTKNL